MSDPSLTPEQQAVRAETDIALLAEDVRREGRVVSELKEREVVLVSENDYLRQAARDMRDAIESIPDVRASRERLAILRAERDALRGGVA